MSDTPTRDWFIHVDSVCSLVGNRRYGLTDDDLAAELIEVSRQARRFADTVGDRYVGGFPITLDTMVAHAAATGQLEALQSKVAEHIGEKAEIEWNGCTFNMAEAVREVVWFCRQNMVWNKGPKPRDCSPEAPHPDIGSGVCGWALVLPELRPYE